MDLDLGRIKSRLRARRKELLKISAATEESRRPVELDESRVGRLSRMEALQDRAIAVEADRRRNLELGRIEAALRRLEEGEFGHCVTCGGEIEPKRLEHDLTTPTCIECARLSDGEC